MQPIKLGINMKLIHQHYSNNENFYNSNSLQSAVKFGIIFLQSKKTIAEPGNSIYLLVAQSTPKACFFMRNIRTPKEFADFVFIHQIYKSLSMVACSGKGSPFAVVHKSQFSRPLHVTAKAWKLSAVTLKKLSCGVTQMYQFIFALIRAPQIKIRLLAESENQARARFTRGENLIFVGRINQNPKLTPAVDVKAESYSVNNHRLPAFQKVAMISPQSEKVIASRGKLNYLPEANDSTPLNRAFFVRNIRTPKEFADFVFNLNPIILSMVERNEPSLTGCLPLVAVFHLVTFYRPTVESLAVVLINQPKDTAEMIYKFLCVNRTQSHFNLCVISLNSTTEEQARLSLSADYRFIAVVARINPQNNRTFSTNGKNHSLPKCEDAGSIESTETKDGNRNRHLSGIFLPKIHSLHVPKKLGTLSYIEFAVRATHGNKALSTNNVGYSLVAVEPLSHPIQGDNSLLTKPKRNPTMKIYPKNNRTLAALPTLSVSSAQGGANV